MSTWEEKGITLAGGGGVHLRQVGEHQRLLEPDEDRERLLEAGQLAMENEQEEASWREDTFPSRTMAPSALLGIFFMKPLLVFCS